jgi:putative membrane protein
MSTPLRRKIFIGLAASLLIASYFVAHVPLSPAMSTVSCLAVILFALPSYRAVWLEQGPRRGGLILLALGAYGLVVESLALATGFPYGSFTYSGLLASKVFGLAPWTVAFAYPPIILLTYTLACRLNRLRTWAAGWRLPALTALLATVCDTVLDPAAVRLRFWYWDRPGFFYGVPLVNFAGWVLTGFLAGLLLHRLWRQQAVPPALTYSGLAILWFWTAVNAWFGHVVPVFIGILLLGLCYLYRPQSVQ